MSLAICEVGPVVDAPKALGVAAAGPAWALSGALGLSFSVGPAAGFGWPNNPALPVVTGAVTVGAAEEAGAAVVDAGWVCVAVPLAAWFVEKRDGLGAAEVAGLAPPNKGAEAGVDAGAAADVVAAEVGPVPNVAGVVEAAGAGALLPKREGVAAGVELG